MPHTNGQYLKGFFIIQALQIFAALLVYAIPSNNLVLKGFAELPKTTILVIISLTAMLALAIAIIIRLYREPEWADTRQAYIESWLIEYKNIALFILYTITAMIVVTSLLALILITPVDFTVYGPHRPVFPVIHTLTMRNLPTIIVFLLFLVETVILTVLFAKGKIFRHTNWSLKLILPALTVITILLLTITHWVILLLQIPLFVKNPIWYWEIRFRPLSLWTLLYSIVTLAALCCAAWFMNARKRPWRSLIIIFIASIWLQFGIGYLEGGGVDALQERYFRTHHRAYAMLASKNNETIIANIINYEHTLATFLFTSTKPPGLMTFYIALERLVNGNPANTLMTEDTRLERLRNLITFVFPILAAGCIFLLYAFVRKYSLMTSDSESLIPSYLYILSPNIVLFSLFVDQAVYPSVFLGGAWLVFRLLNKYSPCSAFVLGIVLYVFAFFSFTILPLFPLAGIFLCLTWWQNRSRVVFFEKVISGLAFLSGVVSAYWLFRWIFNYDFLVRFAHTVEVNRRFDFYTRVGIEPILSPEPVGVRLQQILNALVWNNLDFAAAVGVAVYLLFAIHGLKLLFRIARREAASQEIMLASVFLSFLILNLGGTAQGEVARLWIFWVPAVVLFAGRELLHWKPDKRYPFYALLLAQFITIILTFHFQDLRM